MENLKKETTFKILVNNECEQEKIYKFKGKLI